VREAGSNSRTVKRREAGLNSIKVQRDVIEAGLTSNKIHCEANGRELA
jgi:hypothetical protein